MHNLVVAAQTRLYCFAGNFTLLVDGCRRRDNDFSFFLVGWKELGFFCYNSVNNLAVRCFDESELVHACMDSKRGNQTDVRTFRRLNRTKPSVVCVVNVTNLKACALTRQTARSERRCTALVRDFRQRICLIHELRQLICAEELIDHACNGTRVYQLARCNILAVTNAQSLLNRTRHAREAKIKRCFKLLANCPNTTVRQVVDVIHWHLRVTNVDEVLHNRYDVIHGKRCDIEWNRHVELFINTIASNNTEIVALRIKEQLLEQSPRCVEIRWVA